MALERYGVTAHILGLAPVELAEYQAEVGRDFTTLVQTGPARSSYELQLVDLGYTTEQAVSAEFRARRIG